MKVQCEKCGSEYNIDEERVPPEGLQISCPKCLATFLVSKEGQAPETAGDLFDIGAMDLPGDPVQDDALELDLPGTPEPPTPVVNPGLPPQPPIPDVPAPAIAAPIVPDPPSVAPPIGGSTLPPIGGPGSGQAFSAPLPEAAPDAGGGGDIFDFIDNDIGSESSAQQDDVLRYKIRRKSGKVFGPFDAETVVQMLADHQLMGNEEASTDGYTFKPLGSFSEFAQSIRAMMEEPAVAPPGSDSLAAGFDVAPDDDVAVVGLDLPGAEISAAPPGAVPKKGKKMKLPGAGVFLAGGLVVLLLLMGLGLGFTSYGFFGIGLLTSSSKGSKPPSGQSPAAGPTGKQAPAEVEKLFAEDTHSAYLALIRVLEKKQAAEEASGREQYLLGLSYAAMLRNYGANETYLNQGKALLTQLQDDQPEAAETRKLEAAMLILSDPGQAHSVLKKLIGKNAKDQEAFYLAGWAMAYQKKWRKAAELFDQATVLQPNLAKAFHSLGDVASLQGNFENADSFYAKSAEVDPRHLQSTVERARIVVEVRNQDKTGEQILATVFGKQFGNMAPSEQAKAHALMATIHARRHEKNKVVEHLQKAINLQPDRVQYLASLGSFYLDLGDFAKAQALFEKALKKDPENVDARVGKGRAMWQDGDIVKAKMLLEQTAKKAKADPRPTYLLGRIAEDLDKPAEAMKLYRQAIKQSPKYLTARVAIARLQMKEGKLKPALDALTKAAKINPKSAIVHTGLGEIWLAQGNRRLALKEFIEALRLDPELASARFHLATVHRQAGKLDAALEEFAKVATIAPRFPGLVHEQGRVLYLKAQYAESLKVFEEAIRVNPKDDKLFVGAGLAAVALAEPATAIQYFQSATGINSHNQTAIFELGKIFQEQKDYDKALGLFEKVVELDPKDAEAHYHMGSCYLAQEIMFDAIEEFNAAIKLQPKHVQALIALGRAQVSRQQYQKAIAHFKRVVRARPKLTEVRLALGDAYIQQGAHALALKVFKSAFVIAPKFPGVAFRLGRTYDEMEQKSKAIRFYLKAAKATPTDPMPYYYLGHVYKAKSKNKKALKAFTKYLHLRPDAPDAEEVREEMYFLKNE